MQIVILLAHFAGYGRMQIGRASEALDVSPLHQVFLRMVFRRCRLLLVRIVVLLVGFALARLPLRKTTVTVILGQCPLLVG